MGVEAALLRAWRHRQERDPPNQPFRDWNNLSPPPSTPPSPLFFWGLIAVWPIPATSPSQQPRVQARIIVHHHHRKKVRILALCSVLCLPHHSSLPSSQLVCLHLVSCNQQLTRCSFTAARLLKKCPCPALAAPELPSDQDGGYVGSHSTQDSGKRLRSGPLTEVLL
jgi:hypothetical protein